MDAVTVAIIAAFVAFGGGLAIGLSRRVHARQPPQLEQVRQGTVEQAIAHASEAVIGVGTDGTITAWNAEAARLFGYARDGVIGQPVSILDHRDGPNTLGGLARRFADGELGIRFDTQCVSRSGAVRDMSVVAAPILFTDGVITGLSAVVRDVTDLKEAAARRRTMEERAQQADRMASLGQFAGGVAHDFNNLLGIILNYTQFVADRTLGDATVQADLQEVRLAAQRAGALTRQLLVFTRAEAVRPQRFDLNEALAEVMAMLERSFGEPVEIICRTSSAPLPVLADRGQVQQMLLNLALNARDAMPAGGRLTIESGLGSIADPDRSEAASTRPAARLVVQDTGVGMDGSTLAHMFEPFFTTKPKGHGTGLGLAAVHGTVTDAGGTISVESEEGVGTTITIELPLDDRADRTAEESSPTTSRATEARVHVLVVDDEPALAGVVRRILVDAGYAVMTASSAAEALDLDAGNHFDLLLTDVVMPGLSGPQLAAALLERHPSLTVVYMSGYSDGTLASTLPSDRAAVVHKPFSAEELIQVIGRAAEAGAAEVRIGDGDARAVAARPTVEVIPAARELLDE